MAQCPSCKLSLDSHSTSELMECSMKQLGDESNFEDLESICPNCKHEIKNHTDHELTECTIAYLKSFALE
ncbi:MAG: hypothetical protein GTN97_04435 [Nitrosopumilaceae archaeon]|nr:hypothetical protein [Nitrosopumilaceae archaeon]NIP10287.1 hypothetical protein [Nitrosopumilaceae archaeon]NIS95150.1 hypothetical protein [Nitrosopumilaceae archaeon]